MTRRDLLRAFGFGAAASVVPIGYADYSAYWPEVERSELKLPRWDADGFKVAVLADFHANYDSAVERSRRAIELALAEKPDLIALPGDFVDNSSRESLEHVRRALEPLQDANCPVVATMGNHDYWSPRPERVIETLRESPLKLLRNEMVEVQGVTVAGIDDAIANRHQMGFLHETTKHSKSFLALFHEPDYVKEVPTHVSLQVSGHSHGGQVCLPGGIAVHTPHGARKYRSGFYPDARVPLYVTRGVGTTGPDLRLFCRPEVTILTLRSA